MISIVFLLCLLLGLAASAQAREFADPEHPGSITLRMEWESEPLHGGTLTLYRVAEVVRNGSHEEFALVPELAQSGISLEDLSDPELARGLEELVLAKGLSGETSPIEQGQAVFSQVLPGVYLVSQTAAQATDGFSSISPFLISLPQLVEDRYIYDLTAQPKVPLETKPTEPTEPSETEPTEPTEPDLPQTGQLNWPVPVLMACGFALFAIGWFLRYGKRVDHA